MSLIRHPLMPAYQGVFYISLRSDLVSLSTSISMSASPNVRHRTDNLFYLLIGYHIGSKLLKLNLYGKQIKFLSSSIWWWLFGYFFQKLHCEVANFCCWLFFRSVYLLSVSFIWVETRLVIRYRVNVPSIEYQISSILGVTTISNGLSRIAFET